LGYPGSARAVAPAGGGDAAADSGSLQTIGWPGGRHHALALALSGHRRPGRSGAISNFHESNERLQRTGALAVRCLASATGIRQARFIPLFTRPALGPGPGRSPDARRCDRTACGRSGPGALPAAARRLQPGAAAARLQRLRSSGRPGAGPQRRGQFRQRHRRIGGWPGHHPPATERAGAVDCAFGGGA